MCHALLHDPNFHALLLRADQELAEQCRGDGCHCGGALHRSDYPRKPRGCPPGMREACSSRLSFCCAQCRQRATSMSVRFLGRRVYLSLALVLVSAQRAGSTPAAARLAKQLGVDRRTVQRWCQWWAEQLPLTPLWRANCARFMPPVSVRQLPGELLERFGAGAAPHEALLRLLIWLAPVTARARPAVIALNEGR